MAELKEARLYEKLEEQRLQCHLCAHECLIAEGRQGVCQVRENRDGTLYTRVYGRLIAQHVDPVEKKPLYHFYPGTLAYSIATPGCNFRCRWCQNWEISQMPREFNFVGGREAKAKSVVRAAERSNCRSIAYTYTEPTMFFEYAYDVAKLAREREIGNVYVTNGYMTEEMLDAFHPYLDAANVDLKAFRDETYREYVGARLQPVLDALKKMKELGLWVEVTTLIVPGVNDDEGELRELAQFVAKELGRGTPWHISRFHPTYKMTDAPTTPRSTLQRAQEIGKEEDLRYVYLGNLPGETNTHCHDCGELLIRRSGFRVVQNHVEGSRQCPNCKMPVAGVGMGAGEGV